MAKTVQCYLPFVISDAILVIRYCFLQRIIIIIISTSFSYTRTLRVIKLRLH